MFYLHCTAGALTAMTREEIQKKLAQVTCLNRPSSQGSKPHIHEAGDGEDIRTPVDFTVQHIIERIASMTLSLALARFGGSLADPGVLLEGRERICVRGGR